MIVGSTLFKMIGDPYLSPQFNRGGLAAVFTCQVLQVSGTTPTFDIDVQHKNAEDTSWTTLASFTQMTSNGVYTLSTSGIKEQVRFQYTVGGSAATACFHFLMPAPAWRPY